MEEATTRKKHTKKRPFGSMSCSHGSAGSQPKNEEEAGAEAETVTRDQPSSLTSPARAVAKERAGSAEKKGIRQGIARRVARARAKARKVAAHAGFATARISKENAHTTKMARACLQAQPGARGGQDPSQARQRPNGGISCQNGAKEKEKAKVKARKAEEKV